MKKIMFLAFIALMILGACQKEEMVPNQDAISSSICDSVSESLPTVDLKAGTMTGYTVSPRFGKPNSTYYNFKVYDVGGTLALSVKLYDRATGSITYLPMTKTGSYWLLSTKLSTNGWFDYNYVYTINKTAINSSATYTGLCNSRNTFSSSGTSSICWPFGADGSSWYYRNTWNGGQEGGSGYGWNEGSHTGTTERYSDDWNRTNDLGAIITSPLDGYIAAYGTYPTSLGTSKYVSIVQQASDGNTYRFYVGHLQSYPSSLYVGKYVRAGVDQIGILGSSGASSPHAHTNLRSITNGTNISIPFYFNAQWKYISLAFINSILYIGEEFLPYFFTM